MDENGRGPSAARTVQAEACGSLVGVSCGQVTEQRASRWWPALPHTWAWKASQEGSVCLWVPGALHTQLTEPLHRQRPRRS